MKIGFVVTVRMNKYYYEYAGFFYEMIQDALGWHAVPLAGQHEAANKDKHKMQAIKGFLGEQNGLV